MIQYLDDLTILANELNVQIIEFYLMHKCCQINLSNLIKHQLLWNFSTNADGRKYHKNMNINNCHLQNYLE